MKWTHAWFGRAYIISMLWATGGVLLLINHPPVTDYSSSDQPALVCLWHATVRSMSCSVQFTSVNQGAVDRQYLAVTEALLQDAGVGIAAPHTGFS